MFGANGEGGAAGEWGTWEVGGGLDQGGRACGLSDGLHFRETGIWEKREEMDLMPGYIKTICPPWTMGSEKETAIVGKGL